MDERRTAGQVGKWPSRGNASAQRAHAVMLQPRPPPLPPVRSYGYVYA